MDQQQADRLAAAATAIAAEGVKMETFFGLKTEGGGYRTVSGSELDVEPGSAEWCNTTRCIAGHIISNEARARGQTVYDYLRKTTWDYDIAAAELVGLLRCEASDPDDDYYYYDSPPLSTPMFYLAAWPAELRHQFDDDPVGAAIARIELEMSEYDWALVWDGDVARAVPV